MPFDLSPDYTVETEPSLEGLLRFCESRPADEEYCFTYSHECLLTQYFQSIGGSGPEWFNGDACGYRDARGQLVIDSYKHSFFVVVAQPHPHTFGAAAERCRALLPVCGSVNGAD